MHSDHTLEEAQSHLEMTFARVSGQPGKNKGKCVLSKNFWGKLRQHLRAIRELTGDVFVFFTS